jgi:hypothetical protein
MEKRDDKGRLVKGHKINADRKMPISGVIKSIESKKLNGTYEKFSKNIKERMTDKSYEEIYGQENGISQLIIFDEDIKKNPSIELNKIVEFIK